MLELDDELEKSIQKIKQDAKERQPVRHDVYLSHMKYRESQIEQLKRILQKISIKNPDSPKINFNASVKRCDSIPIGFSHYAILGKFPFIKNKL